MRQWLGKFHGSPKVKGNFERVALLLLRLCLDKPPEETPNSHRVYRLLRKCAAAVSVGGVMRSPPLGPVDTGDCVLFYWSGELTFDILPLKAPAVRTVRLISIRPAFFQ